MAASTKIKIADKIADILRRAEIGGPNNTHLKIVEKLDPKTYKECAKILEVLGGKWNRSAQATIFPKPITEVLAEALDDGEVVNTKNVRQAFYTPPGIADQLVEMACIEHGNTILEPSAGHGALIDAIMRTGVGRERITGIEIDPEASNHVRQNRGVQVFEADFLKIDPPNDRFDRVVMNCPFSNGQDAQHLLHAIKFLKPGGILVGIFPPSILTKTTGAYKDIGAVLIRHQREWLDLPAGSFKESGTGINVGIWKITAPG